MKKETAKNIIHIEYHENGQVRHEVKFEAVSGCLR